MWQTHVACSKHLLHSIAPRLLGLHCLEPCLLGAVDKLAQLCNDSKVSALRASVCVGGVSNGTPKPTKPHHTYCCKVAGLAGPEGIEAAFWRQSAVTCFVGEQNETVAPCRDWECAFSPLVSNIVYKTDTTTGDSVAVDTLPFLLSPPSTSEDTRSAAAAAALNSSVGYVCMRAQWAAAVGPHTAANKPCVTPSSLDATS